MCKLLHIYTQKRLSVMMKINHNTIDRVSFTEEGKEGHLAMKSFVLSVKTFKLLCSLYFLDDGRNAPHERLADIQDF